MAFLHLAVLLVVATTASASTTTIVEWFDGSDIDGEPGCQYGLGADALEWKDAKVWCRTQCDNYTSCEIFGYNWDELEYTDVTTDIFFDQNVWVPGIGWQIETKVHWVGAKRKTNIPIPTLYGFKWVGPHGLPQGIWPGPNDNPSYWAHDHWAINEPDGLSAGDDCVYMDKDGWLHDDDCDVERIFACKRC